MTRLCFLFICLLSITVPQVVRGQTPPLYNRGIISVQVIQVQPRDGAQPELAPGPGLGYYVDVRGTFQSRDSSPRDLSSKITISSDGVVLQQFAGIISHGGGVSPCVTRDPPHCQEAFDCPSTWSLDPTTPMVVDYMGCCEMADLNYCACCTIWKPRNTYFGPFHLSPGSLVDVRVEAAFSGSPELYTSDDSKSVLVPSSAIVPLPSWVMLVLIPSFMLVGISVIRRIGARSHESAI